MMSDGDWEDVGGPAKSKINSTNIADALQDQQDLSLEDFMDVILGPDSRTAASGVLPAAPEEEAEPRPMDTEEAARRRFHRAPGAEATGVEVPLCSATPRQGHVFC
jgi:hypothetical protein